MRLLLDVSAVPERPVGAGYYTLNIAAHLARRDDVETHLLCRQGDGARWEALAPRARRCTPRCPAGRPARLVWEQTRASRLAASLGIDVWHGPHYTMPLRLNVPAVVTVHDLTFFEHPEWHERGQGRVLPADDPRRGAPRRRRDRGERRHRATGCGASRPRSGPIVVAPHGVDHERFTPDGRARRRRDCSRRTASARRSSRSPARSSRARAFPRSSRPSPAIAADNRPLRLVLAGGDGWGSDRVRDAVAASGVPTRVLRPGYLPDSAVAPLFRRAAVVAYPSLAEGFGLNALEALACGAPLVTTTGSALDEVVGDAALKVAPGDVDALADALRDALQPEVAARLRAAGPPRAADFTWERSVDRHVEAYRLATTPLDLRARA